MKIKVLSRADIESTLYLNIEEGRVPHIVLSTTSYSPKVAIKDNPFRVDILRFTFDDLDTRHIELVKQKEGLCKHKLQLFTQDDAKQILEAINNNVNNIEAIITQCDAGISRSSAMAASLSKILNNEDDFFFKNYIPNMLVYTTILNEYYYNTEAYKNLQYYFCNNLPKEED